MPRLTAMWRMRRLSSALLSFGLSMATAVALTPVTGATPGYDAGPTPELGGAPAVVGATIELGELRPGPQQPPRRSERAMRDRRGSCRLRKPGWRASATRGDPHSGNGPADRSVAGQSGRPRGVGGRHGRRDGRGSGGLRGQSSDSIWSGSIPVASATPRRRCAAKLTPSSTPTGANRWSTTARRVWRTSSRCTGR